MSYNQNPNPTPAAEQPPFSTAGEPESPALLFVDGLPSGFTDALLKSLLQTCGGPLRSFHHATDPDTGASKGFAYFAFQDSSITDLACQVLTGVRLGGGRALSARRAGAGELAGLIEALEQMSMQDQTTLTEAQLGLGGVATRVVCFSNMVDVDAIEDDEEYANVVEDLTEEASSYGELVKVVIPRRNPNGEAVSGVGRVFMEYADTDGASKIRNKHNGRMFGYNRFVGVFYPEDKFYRGDYDA